MESGRGKRMTRMNGKEGEVELNRDEIIDTTIIRLTCQSTDPGLDTEDSDPSVYTLFEMRKEKSGVSYCAFLLFLLILYLITKKACCCVLDCCMKFSLLRPCTNISFFQLYPSFFLFY